MPVVIDEFEVVPPPPPGARGPATEPESHAEDVTYRAVEVRQDIERTTRALLDRAARVWAH